MEKFIVCDPGSFFDYFTKPEFAHKWIEEIAERRKAQVGIQCESQVVRFEDGSFMRIKSFDDLPFGIKFWKEKQ